jgi:cation:H+ antiporter
MNVLLIILGLCALVAGGELLVRGASGLARMINISPLVIGLTIVAFGTSSPELAVSIQGSVRGESGIAVGNVLGSNIFNLLIVLGISAIVHSLHVERQVVRVEMPVMIAASLVTGLLALDGLLSRADGGVLVFGLVLYLLMQWIMLKRSRRYSQQESKTRESRSVRFFIYVPFGLVLLVLGAGWLVDGVVYLANRFEISPLIIGLTVVAVGTSLPELFTSLIASVRRQRDLAIGYVVGSNVFNLLAVLGFAALWSGTGLEVSSSVWQFDLPVMLAASILCVPMMMSGGRLSRVEGLLMVAWYVVYLLVLVLSEMGSPALRTLKPALLFVALPITTTAVLSGLLRKKP